MPGTCNSFTPLHLASREGQPHVAGILLEHGADTDARDDGNCTPLHLASRRGKLEVARFLIDHGADVNARDMVSFTPLHLASREGQLEVARFLIDHGADVNTRDMYSFTPLHLASREGQPACRWHPPRARRRYGCTGRRQLHSITSGLAAGPFGSGSCPYQAWHRCKCS